MEVSRLCYLGTISTPKLSQNYLSSNIFFYKSAYPCELMLHLTFLNINMVTSKQSISTRCILHENRCFTKSYSTMSKNLKKYLQSICLFLCIKLRALRLLSLVRNKLLHQYIWQIQLKFPVCFLSKIHFRHFGCFYICIL